MPTLRPQVLVADARRGIEALAAGVGCLVFVLSVSEAHNRSNVRRSPGESLAEYEMLLGSSPSDVAIRVDVATAFDCPFLGKMPDEATLALVARIVALRPDVELCLCDTTGRAMPDQVSRLFTACAAAHPAPTRLALHGHDTYGLGLANVDAAFRAGVRVFDASTGGIGGCPYAPGATGNVATEDLAWMFARMEIATGIDIGRLLPVAEWAADIPGAVAGGRTRLAMAARSIAAKEKGVMGREAFG
jgi:hydroxymethylglutaryl-CoA lyase